MAGPQCCESPPPRDQPPVGVGRLESFEDLTAYVTGPSDATAAVILISDVFGYEAPNFRKLADKVAEAGYLVVVPDYFNGDPYVPDQSNIQDWLKNHAPEKAFEDFVKIIEVLKSRGITSTGAAFSLSLLIRKRSVMTMDEVTMTYLYRPLQFNSTFWDALTHSKYGRTVTWITPYGDMGWACCMVDTVRSVQWIPYGPYSDFFFFFEYYCSFIVLGGEGIPLR